MESPFGQEREPAGEERRLHIINGDVSPPHRDPVDASLEIADFSEHWGSGLSLPEQRREELSRGLGASSLHDFAEKTRATLRHPSARVHHRS